MTLADLGEYARNALHTVKGLSANPVPVRVDALVKRVNAVLMLFDDRLYDLQHGDWVSVEHTEQDLPTLRLSAEALSDAAARLLMVERVTSASRKDKHPQNILLLLPPSEFLAAPVDLPGIAAPAVRAALQLQASTLLAAWEKPLSLAVYSGEREGSIRDMALYLPADRLDGLFDRFADRGLFLTAVTPRPLIFNRRITPDTDTARPVIIQDSDGRDLNYTVLQSGRISRYLCTALHDLDDEALASAWQQELAQTAPESSGQSEPQSVPESISLAGAADYLDAVQRLGGDLYNQLSTSYLFCPEGALAARHQFDRGKLLWRAAAVAAGVAALGVLPFLVQTIQIRSLQSTLQTQRDLAAPARQNQAMVRDFESEWGVLMEFPRQQLSDVLLALQDVISPSVLVALEIEDGFISIEGDSADPQNLLQQLEQNPLFTEVDFARATNNNRYYIDLRLTTVNFPAYQEWYFPERR
jgi:hypothetical protein